MRMIFLLMPFVLSFSAMAFEVDVEIMLNQPHKLSNVRAREALSPPTYSFSMKAYKSLPVFTRSLLESKTVQIFSLTPRGYVSDHYSVDLGLDQPSGIVPAQGEKPSGQFYYRVLFQSEDAARVFAEFVVNHQKPLLFHFNYAYEVRFAKDVIVEGGDALAAMSAQAVYIWSDERNGLMPLEEGMGSYSQTWDEFFWFGNGSIGP